MVKTNLHSYMLVEILDTNKKPPARPAKEPSTYVDFLHGRPRVNL